MEESRAPLLIEGKGGGDRLQGLGCWQLPLGQGQEQKGTLKSSNQSIYSRLIFEGARVGLGLWTMAALVPLGWVCWESLSASDLVRGSPCTHKQALKLLQLYKSELYMGAKA